MVKLKMLSGLKEQRSESLMGFPRRNVKQESVLSGLGLLLATPKVIVKNFVNKLESSRESHQALITVGQKGIEKVSKTVFRSECQMEIESCLDSAAQKEMKSVEETTVKAKCWEIVKGDMWNLTERKLYLVIQKGFEQLVLRKELRSINHSAIQIKRGLVESLVIAKAQIQVKLLARGSYYFLEKVNHLLRSLVTQKE